ncbi:gliding motility lipoprotein GldH [Fulvivirga sp. RKSG066]|nr:gliding motility lipoprotein GldH [Fulvivirga aurantia]MTI22034.1 gliding motility lipoprotein GldH [Fulvivirga aurantia]
MVLAVAFSACDDNRLYEKNVDFNERVWVADSAATFTFNIEDSDQPYNLYLNIRNTNTYPYHNLYVKYVFQDSASSQVINEELVNKNLFNEKTGKPYGSGLGDIFSHQFILLENYEFEEAGIYQIQLKQFMRQDTLEGIVSAGIRVEKARTNN